MKMLTEKQQAILLQIKEYTKGQNPKYFRVKALSEFVGMSNQLLQFHLRTLIKWGFVEKVDGGLYSLKKL